MSAILKVKDKDGNLVDIPAIRGFDGVGVQKVTINNDGELEITYTNNTTVNVGKVVGKDGKDYALTEVDKEKIVDIILEELPDLPSGDGGEKWEVINEIELTENIKTINISLDSSGNPFALKRVYAVFNIKACTTDGEAFSNPYEDITGQPTINGSALFYAATILTVGNNKYKSAMEAELITDDNILIGKCYDLLGYSSGNKINQWIKSNPSLPNGITSVGANLIKTNGMLAAGSTIKIWGVRL